MTAKKKGALVRAVALRRFKIAIRGKKEPRAVKKDAVLSLPAAQFDDFEAVGLVKRAPAAEPAE
ncbi:hypothetical protein [Novosphingobium sp. KN65.2]|uniref:hypothetical protein n=1 Tax=Novosphingobium sp. KN65.2 TaxID=1478134 RepID=UPI0006D562B0|nr:hypothetical protein [Novosphingobium sp. KN65.2]